MNKEKAQLMQKEVCNIAQKMYHSGLVAGTWGNISARIRHRVWIMNVFVQKRWLL
ncbi:MAG: class II aldolase/adducin family protein [Lachnospiraceae bacterium]